MRSTILMSLAFALMASSMPLLGGGTSGVTNAGSQVVDKAEAAVGGLSVTHDVAHGTHLRFRTTDTTQSTSKLEEAGSQVVDKAKAAVGGLSVTHDVTHDAHLRFRTTAESPEKLAGKLTGVVAGAGKVAQAGKGVAGSAAGAGKGGAAVGSLRLRAATVGSISKLGTVTDKADGVAGKASGADKAIQAGNGIAGGAAGALKGINGAGLGHGLGGVSTH